MKPLLTILVAVLAFGFLIFIHELGHFLVARACKINVYEFSIGMGPKLAWYDSKKTKIRYKLCMFPIGGYVSMGEAGADDSAPSNNPGDYINQKPWKRFLVTVSGGLVNIVLGALLAMVVVLSSPLLGSTTVAEFPPELAVGESTTAADGLCVGDEIVKIDGVRVHTAMEMDYEIMRRGIKAVEVIVLRDADGDGVREKVPLTVTFPTEATSGQTVGTRDFSVYSVRKSFGSVLSHTFYRSVCMVKMAWESVIDLVTGRYTMEAVSGPVGITTTVGEAVSYGFIPLLYLISMISINLGVVNLFPLPALDGGRAVFVLIEMITRKRVPPEIEAKIHGIGILLLLLLMVLITVTDVRAIFTK